MEIILYGGMKMSRKEARESAMQLIYQIGVGETNAEESLSSYYDNLEENLTDDEKSYIDECVSGVEKNISKIDSYIEKFSKGWKINRIAKVDIAIMRLALYEMLYKEDVPKVVAVNEAIELAKKFGGENSPGFINGILGNVIRELN
jgi:transcription antitermination protein NusB